MAMRKFFPEDLQNTKSRAECAKTAFGGGSPGREHFGREHRSSFGTVGEKPKL